MTKEQERRILSGQAEILRGIAFLARGERMGGPAMAYRLNQIARDIEDYKIDYLS